MSAENAYSSSASSPKKEDDTGTMKLESAMTTDRRRWRLKDDRGRHTWHYLVTEEEARDWPLTTADKYFLKLPLDLSNLAPATTAIEAAENGLDFFEKLQLPSGHWGGECSGPAIFLGGFVIAWYITKTPIPNPNAIEMRNWLFSTANPDDGGWGLNQDGHSNVCGTVLSYTALRILGVQADDPVMAKARSWLHQMGGAVNSSLWGKFWLAVLGVVDWDIVSPIPPEIWLLPDWLPLSPSRLYIEMRAVALPVSYMSSRRFSCQETDITRSLKAELFTQPITEINWAFHRRSIAPVDNIYPRPCLLEVVTWVYLNVWKPYFCTDSIKKRAESWVSQLIDMEVENMGYLNMAATNAPMNTTLCYFRDGPGSLNVAKQIKRLNEFLWMTENGMLINSTNGAQCWDLALVVQAVCECGLEGNERWRPMLLKALVFLDHQQIKENCKDQEICYRQPRKGGWAFSTKDQGVPVSDCVAEVLKAVILLQQSGHYPKALEDRRIFDAVDVILEYQNRSGGVSAFEARRGGPLLETLNPSQIYGRLMVEYDYPECTTSCLTALVLFQKHWPAYRSKKIARFVQKAAGWIKKNQRADGSWYGSWGICFTYATMFALESLASTGEKYANSKSSQRACHFLLSHQRNDGGWSESFKACETMEYHEDPRGSLVVQTAWALIGLMNAEYPHVEPLLNGVRLIMGRQQDNGEWLSEAIEGAFHDFGAFSYPNYKFSFTIRALGMFSRRFPHIKVDVSRE